MVNKTKIDLLNKLQNTSEWLSGETLSREYGISRVAVWKQIKSLQAEGYPIESGSRGYRLLREKDNLSSLDFTRQENIHFYRELESTMQEAGRTILGDSTSEKDFIILADHQKAGVNRQGGKWLSPEGGVYMTCVLNSPFPLSEARRIPRRGALAVLTALEKCGIKGVYASPPGEIMLENRKIGGILEDYRVRGGRILWYSLGIGIHMNDTPSHASPDTKGIASIAEITGEHVLRKEFVRHFTVAWKHALGMSPGDLKKEIHNRWRIENE